MAIVFFIACFNVAGLLLTRGLQRHPEYAMRSALGADDGGLFRQTLTESLVLAIAGAALGAATRDRHRHPAEGHCGTSGAACGCGPYRLACFRFRCLRGGARRWRCGIAARRPRLTPGSVPEFQRHAHNRRAATSAACSVPASTLQIV